MDKLSMGTMRRPSLLSNVRLLRSKAVQAETLRRQIDASRAENTLCVPLTTVVKRPALS